MRAHNTLSELLVTKRTLKYAMKTNWHMPTELKSELETYLILYWHPEYLRNELIEGTVVREGVRYSVIYHDCYNPSSYRKHHNQVAMSFREAAAEYQLTPIVLVRGVK